MRRAPRRGAGSSPGASCRTSSGILHTRPGPCRCAAPFGRGVGHWPGHCVRTDPSAPSAEVRRRRSHFSCGMDRSLVACSSCAYFDDSRRPPSAALCLHGRPAGDFEGVTYRAASAERAASTDLARPPGMVTSKESPVSGRATPTISYPARASRAATPAAPAAPTDYARLRAGCAASRHLVPPYARAGRHGPTTRTHYGPRRRLEHTSAAPASRAELRAPRALYHSAVSETSPHDSADYSPRRSSDAPR